MSSRPRWRAARAPALLVALGAAASAQGSDTLGDNPVPDLLSGLVFLTLTDEISTGSFRVDNGGDGNDATTFDTLRLPWRHELGERPGRGWLLEGVVGVLWADDRVTLDTASGRSVVREDWLAAGAQVGLGWTLPLGKGWGLRPGAALALAYLENDARYNAAATVDVKPLVDGELLNWEAWAFVASGSLTLERPRPRGKLAWGLAGRGTLARTTIFETSSDFAEGADTSWFGLLRAELGAPFPGPRRWEWDAFAGWSGLFDVDESALGFDELYELGAGVTLPRHGWIPPVRLGAAWIFGPDIEGWSLGVSF